MVPGAKAFATAGQQKNSKGRRSVAQDHDDDDWGAMGRKGKGGAGNGHGDGGYQMIIEGELAACPLMADCDQKFISRVAEGAAWSVHAETSSVRSKGDLGTSLLLVLRGVIAVSVDTQCVGRLTKGNHIGEAMLLGYENEWQVSLTAEASCRVVEIQRGKFMDALEEFPAEKERFSPVFNSRHATAHAETSDLFAGIPEEVMKVVESSMVRRIFFPGETVMHAGSNHQELVLLAVGSARVEMAGRNLRVEKRGDANSKNDADQEYEVLAGQEQRQPAFFGALEFLGLNKHRRISVEAQTHCHCNILHRQVLLNIFSDYAEEMQDSHLYRMAHHQREPHFGHTNVLQIFGNAGCSKDFLDFVDENFEARLYLKGWTMYDAHSKGSLHLLSHGNAEVHTQEKTHVDSRLLEPGEVFGMMSALGVEARPKNVISVVAAENCSCQVLHQSIVVRALELFPDQRMNVLSIANPGSRTMAEFVGMLQKSPFFSHTSPDFIEELGTAALDRIFMPGDQIVNEGESGYSMFILVNGKADVYISDPADKEKEKKSEQANAAAMLFDPDAPPPPPDKNRRARLAVKKSTKQMTRVGHLVQGAVCGELAMLGITQTRSASIQAATLCVLWEVTQERAMVILDRYKDERELFGTVICQNLDLTVTGRLLHLPLFKAFDRKFRMLLTMYCERHAFFPEHQVLREGDIGDKCWILNTGPAFLQKKGFTVKIFVPGMVFGCDHMLGLARVYCGTLTAMTVCHMLAVSRQSYLLALNQYPAKGAAQSLQQVQKVECAALREAVERTAVKKGIWQRYQGEVSGASLSDKELLKRTVGAWHMAASLLRENRMTKASHEQEMCDMLEDWKAKTLAHRKRLEPKRRLDALIKENIYERGPLKTMDDTEDLFPEAAQTPRQQARGQKQVRMRSKEKNKEITSVTNQLVSFLQEWPQPKSSPHYNLRVYDVVREEIVTRGTAGSRLLPLLSSNPGPAKAAGTTLLSDAVSTQEPQVDEPHNDESDEDDESDAGFQQQDGSSDEGGKRVNLPRLSRVGDFGRRFSTRDGGRRASTVDGSKRRSMRFSELDGTIEYEAPRKMTVKENIARRSVIMQAIQDMNSTGGIVVSNFGMEPFAEDQTVAFS